MRRFSFACAAVSIAVFLVLLVSPMFRQALSVGEGSWRVNNGVVSPSKIEWIVQDARQRRDAELLAWAALRFETPHRLAIAREAVSMDRRLTWIYYSVCQGRLFERDPECAPMIETLRQWAPDNAVPWLMHASLVRPRFAYYPKDGPPSDVRWVEAMDRAFASPSYNSYRAQRIELERRVYRTGILDSPMPMVSGIYQQPIPEIADIRWEAKRLRESDPDKVSQFASMMLRDSQSDIEHVIASGLISRDREDEAVQRVRFSRESRLESFTKVCALVVQCSVVGLFLGVGLMFAAALVAMTNVITRREWLKTGVAEMAGVLGATILGVSSLAIYIAYWPYAQVLRTFLEAPPERVNEMSMGAFFSLWRVSFLIGRSEDMMIGVWMLILAGCVVALVWTCSRATFLKRAPQNH